jgi:hypothetical protein
MDDYNSLLKTSLDLKRKRDEKFKEIQTTMIGALDSIEKNFSFLWESDGEPSPEQTQLKSIFEEARAEILDRGNTQIRNLQAEMTHYDISWKRYKLTLPVVDKGEKDGK